MMKKFQTVLAAGLLGLVAAGASALTMVPVNLGLMVEYTDKAFVGKAVSMQPVETSQGWADEVTFQVTEPVIGKVTAGETVTWLQRRSGEQVPMPGMPRYEGGQEYMIFLAGKAPDSQLQAPYALGQGTFRVHRDRSTGAVYARNEFENASLFQGVDTEALATAIEDAKPATAKLAPAEKAKRARSTHSKLHSLRAGAVDLQTLKDAAKTLKSSGAPRTKFARRSGSAAPQLQLTTVK